MIEWLVALGLGMAFLATMPWLLRWMRTAGGKGKMGGVALALGVAFSFLFDPAKALSSKRERDRINGLLGEFGLECSGLAVHGNPVHPNKRHAKKDHEDFVRAVKLAPMLGTDIVITFSGCPGGYREDSDHKDFPKRPSSRRLHPRHQSSLPFGASGRPGPGD